MSDSLVQSTSLTPQAIAGTWGWKISNTFDYAQTHVAPQIITTDDGIMRTAYAVNIEQGITLYDRPQYEWETPTELAFVYNFTADGKFSVLMKNESGSMPHGYILMSAWGQGTYTIQGDTVELRYTVESFTVYNDLQNHLKTEIDEGRVQYLRLSLGNGMTAPKLINVVKRPDGSLVPDSQNPDGFDIERGSGVGQPIDLKQGASVTGILRDDSMVGTSLNDTFNGMGGHDTLTGQGGDDVLVGDEGNDKIWGDQGNDDLLGDEGNDRIFGGKGQDLLLGGDGSDVLKGQGGKDVFGLEKGEGRDRIQDFRNRQDKLGLGQGMSFRKLDIEQQGRNVVISFGNDQLAILSGVRENQLTAADFILL